MPVTLSAARTVTTKFCESVPAEFIAVRGIMTVPAVVNVPVMTPFLNLNPLGTVAPNVTGAVPDAVIVYLKGMPAVAVTARFVSTGAAAALFTVIVPCMLG